MKNSSDLPHCQLLFWQSNLYTALMFRLLQPQRGAPRWGRSRTLALGSLEKRRHQNLSLLAHGVHSVDAAQPCPNVDRTVSITVEEAHHKMLLRISLFARFEHCHPESLRLKQKPKFRWKIQVQSRCTARSQNLATGIGKRMDFAICARMCRARMQTTQSNQTVALSHRHTEKVRHTSC